MRVYDLQGFIFVENETQLLERLRSVRSGFSGAFSLFHDQTIPSLSVHIYQHFAYVHYFPEEGHPGFQPSEMTPAGTPATVDFLMTDGSATIEMPADTICRVEDAYRAAIEFFQTRTMPTCINWFEL